MAKPKNPEWGQDYLKSILSYDPETGIFNWIIDSGRAKAGSVAGYKRETGYVHIPIAGRELRAHRLAWLYMTGEWPKEVIDHKNEIKHDNRFCNLRDVTHAINNQNKTKNLSTSTLPLGVNWDKALLNKPYRAQIKVNGRKICLGRHRTVEAAHYAYLTAKSKYHTEAVDRS